MSRILKVVFARWKGQGSPGRVLLPWRYFPCAQGGQVEPLVSVGGDRSWRRGNGVGRRRRAPGLPDHPLVFGRTDADGVMGLDTGDMGISAVARSVEAAWGVWWVINQSTKRPLLLEHPGGPAQVRLAPGHRHAITTDQLTVLVPGPSTPMYWRWWCQSPMRRACGEAAAASPPAPSPAHTSP